MAQPLPVALNVRAPGATTPGGDAERIGKPGATIAAGAGSTMTTGATGVAARDVAAQPANPETKTTAIAATALRDMRTSGPLATGEKFNPRATRAG